VAGRPEEAGLRKAAEAYNATATDADKVKLIFFNRDGFFDKLAADLAAGSTDFDINLIATYALGRYAPFMDPIVLPDAAKATFPEKVLATMQYDGKQYGIPTDLSLHFMYYRTDLVEKLLSDADWKAKYGEISEKYLVKKLEPKDPDAWTWEDWMATALFFTKSINSDSPTRYGTVLQMKNLLFNMMVWQSAARAQGGDWMNDKGEITVDSPAYRTALDIYKKLYDEGTSPKDSTTYEFAEANAAFGAGQAATMVQWNAAFGDLDNKEKTPARGRQDRHRGAAHGSGRPVHSHPWTWSWHQQGVQEQGWSCQVPELAGYPRRHGDLCQGRRFAGAQR
jgi:ABC-type sugar transport system, periplasmic component